MEGQLSFLEETNDTKSQIVKPDLNKQENKQTNYKNVLEQKIEDMIWVKLYQVWLTLLISHLIIADLKKQKI